MTTQAKKTANDVATLFLSQALRETQAYLERMRAAGEEPFLRALYDTCICGGVNTELTFKQARWLTTQMKREGDSQPLHIVVENQVVGSWLYRSWTDRRNKLRYRIIYTLASSFAAAQLHIDDEKILLQATTYGHQIAVSDLMQQAIEQYARFASCRTLEAMASYVCTLECGRVTLYGKNLFEGPQVEYQGVFGRWRCAMTGTLQLKGKPQIIETHR